jgi:hypothetical protein
MEKLNNNITISNQLLNEVSKVFGNGKDFAEDSIIQNSLNLATTDEKMVEHLAVFFLPILMDKNKMSENVSDKELENYKRLLTTCIYQFLALRKS